ncbi:MAG: hypothetical protein GY915_08485 [bacterium]|nr:hypothetical protein [bacterium]
MNLKYLQGLALIAFLFSTTQGICSHRGENDEEYERKAPATQKSKVAIKKITKEPTESNTSTALVRLNLGETQPVPGARHYSMFTLDRRNNPFCRGRLTFQHLTATDVMDFFVQTFLGHRNTLFSNLPLTGGTVHPKMLKDAPHGVSQATQHPQIEEVFDEDSSDSMPSLEDVSSDDKEPYLCATIGCGRRQNLKLMSNEYAKVFMYHETTYDSISGVFSGPKIKKFLEDGFVFEGLMDISVLDEEGQHRSILQEKEDNATSKD